MNGLTVIDEKQLGRGGSALELNHAEKAYISINNLLAVTRIREATAEMIDSLLDDNGVAAAELRPRFRTLYAHVLQQFVLDLQLTEIEESDLEHLKRLLRLTGEDVERVFRSVVHSSYEHLARRSSAGQLPGTGIDRLREVARSLRIPESVVGRLLEGL